MSDSHAAHGALHVVKHALQTDVGKQVLATATAGAIAAAPIVVPAAIAAGATYGLYKLFTAIADH